MVVFDRAHFDHMTAGDAALQCEVIELFRAQAEAWSACLHAGAEWRASVHTIKGSARGIGLDALAHACETAEAAPDGEVAGALAALKGALTEALAALAA